MESIVAFLLIAFGSALVWHRVLPRYLLASWGAAFCAAAAFLLAAYVQAGYFDPLAAVAFVASFLVAFPIALLVGWLFLKERRENPR